MKAQRSGPARTWHLPAGAAATALFGLAFPSPSPIEAKAPGVSHCYRGVCHRVRTVEETRRLIGQTVLIETSHYDRPGTDRFNTGTFTSNGERFDARDPARVASVDLPDGTELLLRNPDNGRVSHVRVNDFGPFRGNRLLDVTRRVADDLGFARRGVTSLEVTVVAVPRAGDLRYHKDRPRLPTHGYIGSVAQDNVARLVANLIAERAGQGLTQVAAAPGRTTPADAASPNASQATEEARPSITVAFENPTLVPANATARAPLAPPPVPQVSAQLETSHLPRTVDAHVRVVSLEADTTPVEPQPRQPLAADAPLQITAVGRLDAREPVAAAEPEFQVATDATFVPGSAVVSMSAEPSAGSPALAMAWAASPDSRVMLLFLMVLLSSLLVASVLTPKTSPSRSRAARTDQKRLREAGTFERAWARTMRDASPAPVPVPFVEHAPVVATQAAAPAESAGSLLEPDIEIEGTVRCKGRLTIAGRVAGRVEAGHLVILACGSVEGDIFADTIEIAGVFRGRIVAGSVDVKAGGRVTGDIETTSIAIDETAEVDASIKRTRR